MISAHDVHWHVTKWNLVMHALHGNVTCFILTMSFVYQYMHHSCHWFKVCQDIQHCGFLRTDQQWQDSSKESHDIAPYCPGCHWQRQQQELVSFTSSNTKALGPPVSCWAGKHVHCRCTSANLADAISASPGFLVFHVCFKCGRV